MAGRRMDILVWKEYFEECHAQLPYDGEYATQFGGGRIAFWCRFTDEQRIALASGIRDISGIDLNTATAFYPAYEPRTVDDVESDLEYIDRAVRAYEKLLGIQLNIPEFPANSIALARRARKEWLARQSRAREHLAVLRRNHGDTSPILHATVVVTDEDDVIRLHDIQEEAQGYMPEELRGQGWAARSYLLGEGGQGRATLWLKLSDDGRILDRIVVKDSELSRSELLNAANWFGNVYKPRKRKHIEVEANETLSRHTNKVARIVNWSIRPDSRQLRILFEFCEHGDLAALSRRYSLEQAMHVGSWTERPANDPAGRISPFVPEPFVWHVFACLIEVATAMDQALPRTRGRPGRNTIVHRDMKMENVFLAGVPSESSSDFSLYPTVKMGDFGLAIATSDNDPFNPIAYTTYGTPGGLAPEQCDFYDHNDGDRHLIERPFKLGSLTNVWAIGKVVMDLMNHPYDPSLQKDQEEHQNAAATDEPSEGSDEETEPDSTPSPSEEQDDEQGPEIIQPTYRLGDQIPAFQDPALYYSEDLRGLVLRCLQFDPADRPTPREVQAEILRHTGGDEPDSRSFVTRLSEAIKCGFQELTSACVRLISGGDVDQDGNLPDEEGDEDRRIDRSYGMRHNNPSHEEAQKYLLRLPPTKWAIGGEPPAE